MQGSLQLRDVSLEAQCCMRWPTKDDDTCRSVSDLLVLRPRQLNHRLGGWVGDINLSKDSMSIIRQPSKLACLHLFHGIY
jgi:hypothetical protein